MKIINYIDLGCHTGQEIELFKYQFKHSHYIRNIYGVEANSFIHSKLEDRYINEPNVKFFCNAIYETDEEIKLYIANNNGLGSSIFSTKEGVSKAGAFLPADGITFKEFIDKNIPSFYDKDVFNILKMNIEGAELYVYEDMVKYDLFKYINIFCGHPYHDIEKVRELDNTSRKNNYYDIIEKNDIKTNWFCADDPVAESKCINLKKFADNFYKKL